jgi:phage tail-like protein
MRSFALGVAVCLSFAAPTSPATAQTLVGPHVELTVAGTPGGVFPAAAGIGSSQQVIEQLLASGVVRKTPGRVSWSDVLLERGLSADLFLWRWRAQVEQGLMTDARLDFELTLLDADETPIARWTCVNGWPSRISAPRSRTENTLVAIENVTLVSEGCTRVAVADTRPPVLDLPGNLLVEATSAAGAATTFSAGATDLIDPSPAVSCAPASGSTFPLGPTTVTCTATDDAGNSASGSFTVTVQDTTAPSLTLPADIVAEATSPAGAVVTFVASATDLVDAAPVLGCVPPSGSTFPLGPTTVTCTATDATGNSASADFSVTVEDTTAPSLTLPADIVAEATSAAGAVVTFAASATDTVDAAPAVVCVPPSGSTFPLGPTTVTCTATDAGGNGASADFSVTVEDTIAPSLTLPADIVAEATSAAGAVVTFVASATDVADAAPVVVCVPPSGSTFPLGPTTVTCTAADAAGNSDAGTFSVTVQDTTAPSLTLPADIVADATSAAGAAVTFTATAFDAVDATPTVVCVPPSGSTFPLGATTVTCTATDAAGNSDARSFSVTVRDTTPPAITLEIVEAAPYATSGTLTVRYVVADLVDPAPAVTLELANNGDPFGAPPLLVPPPPAVTPAGATDVALDPRALAGRNTVRVTATDATGNSAQATLDFTVVLRVGVGQVVVKPEYFIAPFGWFTARVSFPAPYDPWTITAAAADGAPLVKPRMRLESRFGHAALLTFDRARLSPPVDTRFVVSGTFRYKGNDCPFEGADSISGVLFRRR